MATRYIDTNLDMFGNTISNAIVEGYYTSDEVDAKLASFKSFEFKVVDELPEAGESNIIYLVPSQNSKAKNVKDEYIWTDGGWEQIGSTSFKLDITQNGDGIAINNVALQDADETTDGLMTKEMVTEFRGKQDVLTAGANITIENGVISATGGGGGGSGGGHNSCVKEFAGDGQTEYLIGHGLDTYNIIFQIRTVDAPVRYVFADVEAPDQNSLKITFAQPQNQRLSISIMASDKIVAPTPGPGDLDVSTKTIATPSSVWSIPNPSGDVVFCQLFDDTGNEIRGDVTQESSDEFTPVIASLDRDCTGTMLIAKASISKSFTDFTDIGIDVVQEGFSRNDRFLVQTYTDGTGRFMPDIIQDSGTGVISVDFGDTPVSGYLVARKATVVHEFTDATEIRCVHNLGRMVGAQVYLEGTGQAMADIECVDDNTVVVSSNIPITGYLAIL